LYEIVEPDEVAARLVMVLIRFSGIAFEQLSSSRAGLLINLGLGTDLGITCNNNQYFYPISKTGPDKQDLQVATTTNKRKLDSKPQGI